MKSDIYNRDCLEAMAEMPSASVDAIVTDPPYAIPTIVAANRNTTINVGDLSLIESAFRVMFAEFDRILKPTGRFFMFCDGTSYPVIFRAAYGKFSTALLVWNKGRIGMGREFRKSHELIMHCWKSDTPIFKDGIGRPDVLDCKPIGGEREHPAQKPVDLLKQLLLVCGDTIFDPFAGSGSTGVACKELNKNFIGFEIDDAYCEIAKRRIVAAEPQTQLFRPTPMIAWQDSMFKGERESSI